MGEGQESLPLLKGTLDLLVMKALSGGPRHGYAVASWIEDRSQGKVAVEDSALYQALHRLEGRRLVEAEWGLSENNRRARFYTLTPRGRRAFASEAATWTRYADFVRAALAEEVS